MSADAAPAGQPTHRMVCFQSGRGGAMVGETGSFQSWCALFPLDASDFTPADRVLRLDDDATLLDVDPGSLVVARERSEGVWEVRPPLGPGSLLAGPKTGRSVRFAESRGLLPLVVPRPGRPISPHARSFSGNRPLSESTTGVEAWLSRISSRQLVGAVASLVVLGALAAVSIASPSASSPSLIFYGCVGIAVALGTIRSWRRRRRVRRATVAAVCDRRPVDLRWRPSLHGGAEAWLLISMADHDVESPVIGLRSSWADQFPGQATIHGRLEAGHYVRVVLDDGTALHAVEPLRHAHRN